VMMCKHGTEQVVKLCKPRPNSCRTEIVVDTCIASIVQALNDANIETTYACCGHYKAPGSIMLADGRELLVVKSYKLATEMTRLITESGEYDNES